MNASVLPNITLDQFECADVDPHQFDHEAHVYVAWLFLENFDVTESMDRYRTALKRLTMKLGIPDKYHETITCFFVLLINEREAATRAGSWAEFRDANRDVFDAGGILRRYYESEVLDSELARRTFVLPVSGVSG